MSCTTYKELLHSYVAEELSELQKSAVQRHLASCDDCSKEVQEIKALKYLVKYIRLESINLDELKYNIMSAVKNTHKAVASYDINVIWRLGISLVACGVIMMLLNFTSLGIGAKPYTDKMSSSFQCLGEKMSQPINMMNKGIADISNRFVNINGIAYRIQQ